MKVLWISNSLFPEVYEELGLEPPVTVGWVNSAAKALLKQSSEISLGVASFYEGKEYQEIVKKDKIHFLIPINLQNSPESKLLKQIWIDINEKFKPDVVHIHGTEYAHSYSYLRACKPENVVVSIQGLVSVYERYYYGHISNVDLLKSVTIRDMVRLDTIFQQRRNMQKRAYFEKEAIKLSQHIIGRTSWDKANVWAINPNAEYHFCNETLRPSFYERKWSYGECEKHSIFVSQAHYPIKGFHQLVKALPIVLRHFPDTKVYVAGNNFFSNKGIRINGYGNYVNKLIKRYQLGNHVHFTGLLTEPEMCERFLKSNIFVCPSAIENSPNSVGEAQLLGVPTISSFVGGTKDMVEHDETGLLYRFEEFEMLAAGICKLFSDNELAFKLSKQSKVVANDRHNGVENAKKLCEIYSSISNKVKHHS